MGSLLMAFLNLCIVIVISGESEYDQYYHKSWPTFNQRYGDDSIPCYPGDMFYHACNECKCFKDFYTCFTNYVCNQPKDSYGRNYDWPVYNIHFPPEHCVVGVNFYLGCSPCRCFSKLDFECDYQACVTTDD